MTNAETNGRKGEAEGDLQSTRWKALESHSEERCRGVTRAACSLQSAVWGGGGGRRTRGEGGSVVLKGFWMRNLRKRCASENFIRSVASSTLGCPAPRPAPGTPSQDA